MSDFFILAHVEARKRAAARCMEAPDGYTVKFSLPKRSSDQNAKMHAMIFEFAAQYEHCGKKWDGDDMKRILIDQFRRDTLKDPEIAGLWTSMGVVEMAPSFDGSGVVMLGAQSRKFPLKLASIMIEWLYALGVELNIHWSDNA